MADTLAGFPFWSVHFDDQGEIVQPAVDFLLADLGASSLTDLFVFSHGWNDDEATALNIYNGFFGQVADVLADPSVVKRPGLAAGVIGIIWPSILFPGDTVPNTAGGAASFGGSSQLSGAYASELPKVFTHPAQQQPLQDLLALLAEQPPDNGALLQFRDKLAALVRAGQASGDTTTGQDNLEFQAVTAASDDVWMQLLDAFAAQPSGDVSAGGAADFGDPFGRLWNGSKNLLRVGTYWQMKNRAGVIGKTGLGPLLGGIHAKLPALNIHLLGHSFGARLVSYALAGLPDSVLKPSSAVKSLFLIQGAFSHFTFASALPFDATRAGDLAGMSSRVDGPLLTTYSLKDMALSFVYPAASVLVCQDASASTDLLYRWEGMGQDGAQAVDAAGAQLGEVLTAYEFQTGKWLNLDGNQVIVNGGPPSGAHSDIIHPEIAWAAVSAAKVASIAPKAVGR
jgi:hypothetical protein